MIDTRIREALWTGELVAFREGYWPAAAVQGGTQPGATPAPSRNQGDKASSRAKAPSAPDEVTLTIFVLKWVDEIGMPIGGLDVHFTVSGQRRRKTTGGDGIARFTDPSGSSFAFAEPVSLDAVREAVRTRWSTIREGELITEADALVLQLRKNVVRDVQFQADEPRIISVQPHVARTRLLGGGFFDVSKSFLLPNGLDGIRAIVASYNQEPNARLLIVGHTDTAGRPDDNDLLSLERACALEDYLTDNAEGWLTWYRVHGA